MKKSIKIILIIILLIVLFLVELIRGARIEIKQPEMPSSVLDY